MAMMATASTQVRPWSRLPDRRETMRVAAVAVALGFATGIVFSLWPRLDIAIAGSFLGEDGGFHLTRPVFWPLLRETFMHGYALWYVAITVGLVMSIMRRRDLFGFGFHKWFYLTACSLIGPLLLVNVLLKEHWGRWRPREIIELGGGELFTRPLQWTGTCDYNCSFVSGEVASMVMAFIGLAFVTTAWRPVFYVLTVLMGLLAAAIRVGQIGRAHV